MFKHVATWVVCFFSVVQLLPRPVPKPWNFIKGEYSREMLPRNHNLTERPPGWTGKTFMYFPGYYRGWNTSLYFTTLKVWFLKHTLPYWNYTNVWETERPTRSIERYQNIKQLRKYTAPKDEPKTLLSYELGTFVKLDYDQIKSESWAKRHDDYLRDKLISDGGVYNSDYDNSFYRDPKEADFGTADYLTKIYTQREPRELFGTLWDFPQ